MNEFHALLRAWETFFLLLGTAGATLAGLMFVALNLDGRSTPRQNLPVLRSHSDPALLAFVLNLGLGALLLMPSLTPTWFAVALLLAGLLGLVYILTVLWRLLTGTPKPDWDLADGCWYAGAPVLGGTLLLVSGGLGLSGRVHIALTLAGMALLLYLLMGVRNAWDLMTYALARPPQDEPPGAGG